MLNLFCSKSVNFYGKEQQVQMHILARIFGSSNLRVSILGPKTIRAPVLFKSTQMHDLPGCEKFVDEERQGNKQEEQGVAKLGPC